MSDGVINVKPPEGGYVRTWDEFRLIPAAVDWIRLFNAAGFLVIVVTNQRGIARGLVRLLPSDSTNETGVPRHDHCCAAREVRRDAVAFESPLANLVQLSGKDGMVAKQKAIG